MRVDDLPLMYRLLLATYRWRQVTPVPVATRRRRLEESRVALVTSAGLVPPGETPFDLGARGGDGSFRVLPDGTSPAAMSVHHRSEAFDRRPLREDANTVYPREVLESAVDEGRVGSLAPRHLSFMGSITAPGRLVREHAPAAAELLAGDAVDVALLVPV